MKFLGFIIVFIFVFLLNSFAQQKYPEVSDAKSILPFAWAGGLNAAQFGSIDLNLDGTEDLLVLERHGNRVLPFIKQLKNNTWQFDPAYIVQLPELHDWFIMRDFDVDGRQDIFTYSDVQGGIQVYHNISEKMLAFELVAYPHLLSYQGSGYTNILATEIDYPAIDDLDGDGDLDILVFSVFGAWVELHNNMSMETYGHKDSLLYEKVTACWGEFAESEESNELFLDTCNMNPKIKSGKINRHTGSSFFMYDIDSDNDKDLILGDFDYANLILLKNGGTQNYAKITSYETSFPTETPVELYSLPAVFSNDLNDDGVLDLIITAFDYRSEITDNAGTVWYYEGIIQEGQITFNFVNNGFFQKEMLDFGAGAYPAITDFNQDGLMDLVVGNWGLHQYSYFDANQFLHSKHKGMLAALENTGNNDSPSFQLVDEDYLNLSAYNLLGLYPSFGDIDNDQDIDLILGNSDGTLIFFNNSAGPGVPFEFDEPEFNFLNIDVADAGSQGLGYSTPCLFDLDADGLTDLIIGEIFGNLNFYQNTTNNSQLDFTLVNDQFGGINVTNPQLSYYGYSTPWLFKNGDGEINLLVGSEEGKIYLFENIENNLSGNFNQIDNLNQITNFDPINPDRGMRTSASCFDFNNDNWQELIVGNYAGGLEFFSQLVNPQVNNISLNTIKNEILVYPNPGKDIFNIVIPKQRLFNYTVYNIEGEILQSGKSSQSLDLSQLDNGIYFLSIFVHLKNQNEIQKVVILK